MTETMAQFNVNVKVPMKCFGERCFYVFVPPCATGKRVPLLLDIHALANCPKFQAAYSGWWQKAMEHCFVLVWPVGRNDPSTDLTCFQVDGGFPVTVFGNTRPTPDCCCTRILGQPTFPASDMTDVDFLSKIVLSTYHDFEEDGSLKIDPKRVYFAGHSNGCITSLAMAAQRSDLVAAVGCHAGTLVTPPTPNYEPVPILKVHGTSDAIVPYDGVPLTTGSLQGIVLQPNTAWASAEYIQRYFASLNGCDPEIAVVETEVGRIFRGLNCTADSELVTLDSIDHFAHVHGSTDMAWNFVSTKVKSRIPLAYLGPRPPSPTSCDDTDAQCGVPLLSIEFK